MNIEQYFANLIRVERVPTGYHNLKYYRVGDTFIINYKSDTFLEGINKIVPRLIREFTLVNQNLLTILRKTYLDYDFLFEDLIYNESERPTEVTFKYRIIEVYLSLSIIPSDIIYEIIKYLDKEDYNNLAQVIKLEMYPKMKNKLKFQK